MDRFEADLAAFTGARHAVAIVNGTCALHLALGLAGVQPGDEVLRSRVDVRRHRQRRGPFERRAAFHRQRIADAGNRSG